MNKSNTRILITGGCGFVGHHLVEYFLKNTDWEIVVLDKLNYASNGFDRLRDIKVFDENRVKIFTCDLVVPLSDGLKKEIGELDYIINLASESHVDNSIVNPVSFIQNNVNLVLNLLEWVRVLKNLKKFIQFSTDEVFGTAPEGINYQEGDRHNSGNPYSASKSAQEAICRAYANTYGSPINITNTMNVAGERQHPEKFIPSTIRKVYLSETVIIHSNPEKTKAGSRFYIHARNVASAIHFVLEKTNENLDKIDASKGVFNIVGEKEIDNLALAKMIADCVGKTLKYEMIDFHSSRPGHDLRYALNSSKMASYGWHPPKNIEEWLPKVVRWSLENKNWIGL
jgi:dTDP-glucose 4,6-dehydratase